MWAALKSDLSEFVSGVADETGALSSTTANAAAAAAPTTPEKNYSSAPPAIGEDGDVLDAGFDSTGVIASASDEVARRRNHAETYLEPLNEEDPDVQEFLDHFDIDQKTTEIAQLLQDNPDTLQAHFDAMATEEVVTYAQFWQRYFYRCDEERVEREWKAQEEAQREARAQAITGGLNTVRDLFGGAVKAVSSVVQTDNDPNNGKAAPTSPFAFADASSPGLGLFGAAGRPPFVMHTVDDDDDDEEIQGSPIPVEEEEEEEELGWDDDDDEEDDDVYDEGESEEITFSGGRFEIAKLQEQLNQAMTERDQLRETVELQKEEIGALRSGDRPANENSLLLKELEKLKMQLFEKDSEMGALKASLEDTHEDSRKEAGRKAQTRIETLERELEKQIHAREEAEVELGKTYELWEATKSEWEQSKERMEAMQTRIAELEAQAESPEGLDAALAETKMQLQESKDRCALLEEELAKQQQQQEHRAAAETQKEDNSADTASTGVKIENKANVADDDEDGDWGDDW